MTSIRVLRPAGAGGRIAALLAAVALPAAAGCGGEERQGTEVSPPPDSAASLHDDPCKRQNSERRKRFHVTDDGFTTKRVVVRAGTPVTFINCGDAPHTVTKLRGRGPDFDSGDLQPGDKFDRTLVSIGTQTIVDKRNPGSKMIVEVRGLPGEPQN